MLKSLFGSSSEVAEVQNDLNLQIQQPPENEKYRLPYFFPGSLILLNTDKIIGSLKIPLIGGKSYAYDAIYISILGQNRIKADDSLTTFYKRTKIIKEAGTATKEETINFAIKQLDYPVPSFYGTFVDCRYIIQARIKTKKTEYVQTVPVYILFTHPVPDKIEPMKAEIGIQNVLHIEFVLQNPTFDCGSVMIGKILFLVVKIRIVRIILQIRREEYYSNGYISSKNESIISEYEILDGMPCRGDQIPIRFYFPGVKVWPYPLDCGKNLEVKYFMRFLLIDENSKHYYKELTKEMFRFVK